MSDNNQLDKIKRIRNFAIIAHIDHGKSTLSDRIIEHCGGVEKREMQNQILDSMQIEKERGITIKAQTVRLKYKAKDGIEYQLNLMDTPGHVDFAYEVNRSLASCEGSILVVDVTQGVEAQTLANVYQAIDNNHEIVIALNKIDLPASEVEKTKEQIEEIIGLDASESILVSAKQGIGIEELLEAVVTKLPCPKLNNEDKLRALLIDSWYDPYLGVVILTRIFDGVLKKGMKIKMLATDSAHTVDRVGFFTPKQNICDYLEEGEVGFFTASIKELLDCKVGDTITEDKNPCLALPGFKPNLPVVFCGLYPTDASQFSYLRDSLAKLHLNDASFEYQAESSTALGYGFRCGFLGLLHLEIIQERLEREYNIEMVTTAPSVVYRVHLRDTKEPNKTIEVHNSADLPDPTKIEYIEEPWVKATIMVPDQFLGPILLSIITHRTQAEYRGREMCKKLKDLIPQHLFQIPIQAAIGGKIVARETIKALRKDVLAKCYGGDITRKRKLLDKQKEGKKRMRTVGNVEIPQSAFIAALKLND